MNCPNCKSNVSDKIRRCNFCGANLTLYKKILRTSNLYYNTGLSRAKVRDLSGAITFLKYSLELNKENTEARNLLGLIYFEVGETVAALSEWVISKHFKSEDNEADRYIEAIQSNPTLLDNLNQAVKRYNRALQFANQGSDDLATIQLKRVVSLNPRFIKAYQLLALIYIKNKDYERAKRYLYKANKIDVSNTTTLRYLKAITEDKEVDNLEGYNKEDDFSSTIIPVSSYQEDKPNIMAFVNLVIGIILGVALMAILVIPSMDKKEPTDQLGIDIDYDNILVKYQEQEEYIRTLEEEKNQLNSQAANLQEQIDNFDEVEDSPIYNDFFIAINVYNEEMEKAERDRDYLAIADQLLTVDENLYEPAAIDLMNSMKEEVYPIAIDHYYDLGHNLYSDSKYEESLEQFKKALEIDSDHVDSLYFTARAYHRLEDYNNAAIYYELIINDFPDSRRFKNSEIFLEEIAEELQ